MRILIVGGSGLIGGAVAKELSPRHEVILLGRSQGLDIQSKASIRECLSRLKPFDAIVATLGKVHWEEFGKMTEEKYLTGLQDKLMGQVNLVLEGVQHINDGGSFTLTSGILNRDPIKAGSSAAMVNGAVEGFVIGSAIELPRQLRINCVSPTVLAEAMDKYASYFRGYKPVPAHIVALAYAKSVEGLQTGQIYKVD